MAAKRIQVKRVKVGQTVVYLGQEYPVQGLSHAGGMVYLDLQGYWDAETGNDVMRLNGEADYIWVVDQ